MLLALKVWVLSLATVFSFTVQWSVNPERCKPEEGTDKPFHIGTPGDQDWLW